MKLTYRIITRLSAAMVVALGAWGTLFYVAIVDEIRDETDDALETYSEGIIARALAGQPLPTGDDGTNNSFFIRPVDEQYRRTHPGFSLRDEELRIASTHELEPARVLRAIFKNADGNWNELTVSTPTIEKESLRRSILVWSLGLFVAMLAIVLIVTALVFNRSLSPLYRLLRWLDKYELGTNNERLCNTTSVKEFQKLNQAAEQYAARAESAFAQQKRFTSDAAHELQTPLAVCQNRLELLIADGKLSEQQTEQVAKTLATLASMIRLNKTLLLLSRIESKQFLASHNIDLALIAVEQLETLAEIHAASGIKTHLNAHKTNVQLNASLAEALVSNLLRNAFVHNVINGQVWVDITPQKLVVANTGQAEPLDTARIFERFYHNAALAGSTGLGLAIVKAACHASNLLINYQFQNNRHTFTVTGFNPTTEK